MLCEPINKHFGIVHISRIMVGIGRGRGVRSGTGKLATFLMRDHNGPAGRQRGGFLVRELLKQFAPLHFTIFVVKTEAAIAAHQLRIPTKSAGDSERSRLVLAARWPDGRHAYGMITRDGLNAYGMVAHGGLNAYTRVPHQDLNSPLLDGGGSSGYNAEEKLH